MSEPVIPAWAPSAQAVADLLVSRTAVDGSGGETGTFSTDTRPSLALVERLIAAAAGELDDRLGLPVPDDLADQAARLAARRAAALVLRSLDDPALGEPSAYVAALDAQWIEGLTQLVARLRPVSYFV